MYMYTDLSAEMALNSTALKPMFKYTLCTKLLPTCTCISTAKTMAHKKKYVRSFSSKTLPTGSPKKAPLSSQNKPVCRII